MDQTLVDLSRLDERHPGVTPVLAQGYCEAAATCFSKYHEPPNTAALITEGSAKKVALGWNEPSVRTMRAFANSVDATRDGAYAVPSLWSIAYMGSSPSAARTR